MYCLAVDIGASSGRVILGKTENGRIALSELHRFPNGAVRRGGQLCWEVDRLFAEIKTGMKKCAAQGIRPHSMAIDCFGVDFVLLDAEGRLLGDTVSYRDARTDGMPEAAAVPPDAFYRKTGIVGGKIHSVYQLLYLQKETEQLKKAARFLHLPDYLNYLLTGVAANEYTISQTSLLINAETGDFDGELLDALALPRKIFEKPLPPATVLGRVKPEIAAETGIDCAVVLAPSHDTVSAAAAVPAGEDCIFISSGTWSMLGTYVSAPLIRPERAVRFSNLFICPGHYGLIRGSTGLWMMQAIRRELGGKHTFDSLCALAQESAYPDILDADAPDFSAPESMLAAVRGYAASHGFAPMDTLGDAVRCVYRGLAAKYAESVREIESFTEKTYDSIYIVGGGSRDEFLNRLTEGFTGKKVYAGPAEATAMGNIAAQLTSAGVFGSLWEAKKIIMK